MLDAHIIDAIRRHERRPERDPDGGRARLELPLYREELTERPPEERGGDDEERGVIIIPLDPSVPLRECL